MRYGPEDLRGQQFGAWTVLRLPRIRHQQPGGKYKTFWRCRCSCGNESDIAAFALRNGSSTGCFACGRSKLTKHGMGQYYRQVKAGSAQRDLVFSISVEYMQKLLIAQQYRCAFSGLPIFIAETQAQHVRGNSTASLDRIDNEHGYVEGNVHWVHKDINFMKGTLSADRFIELCLAVAETVQVPARKLKKV